MINITCPVCSHAKIALHPVLFTIEEEKDKVYEIRKCSSCQSVYTYFNTPIDIDLYYDGKDYTVKDTQKTIFYKIQAFEYNLILKKIKRLLSSNDYSVLDFGSGKGLFLHFAQQMGFKGKGIESSVPRAAYAKEHFGLEISTNYYSEGAAFQQKFNVLTLFHVLEHLNKPAEITKNLIKDNLQDKGILVIEVPNFTSWQSAWAGKRWLHLDVPRHICHYTPTQLRNLVEQNGCIIRKEEYFSFHLGIIGMVQTIFSWFGYTGFLIGDLKEKKSPALLLKIALALPFALALEGLASAFKKGGVIRYYAEKKDV